MSRRHKVRRLSRHKTYDARELAAALEVNITTVRIWCGKGLKPIERRRPFLFHGGDVTHFLEARAAPRQPLAAGELYCVACRSPRMPENLTLQWQALSPLSGNFIGTCPVSGHRMRRRVRATDIEACRGPCTVVFEDGASTMTRGGEPAQAPVLQEALS